MKYLCLIFCEEKRLDGLSKNENERLWEESGAYANELRSSGHGLAMAALQPVRSATTVRIRNGKLSVTDGPFAETKEQLAGFVLIDAKDLNEAIQVAAKVPAARFGSVEVRPVREEST